MKHFDINELDKGYLAVQAGDISHLLGDDTAWRQAYDERIERVYQSMLPALPENVSNILDVGGGLSGIGARLSEHYDHKPTIAVLDGKNDLAVVNKHAEPFNNATRTHNFLMRNGVRNHVFYAPEDEFDRKFDLVVSTQAWCFHFAPYAYLARIKEAMQPGAMLIVDVRKNKPEWFFTLDREFAPLLPELRKLAEADKWIRAAAIRV